MDTHLYLFSKWVLDVLESHEKDIGSIKGELIPFLVRLQLNKKHKRGIPEQILHSNSIIDEMSSTKQAQKEELLLGDNSRKQRDSSLCLTSTDYPTMFRT